MTENFKDNLTVWGRRNLERGFFLIPNTHVYSFGQTALVEHNNDFIARYKSLENIANPLSPHFAREIEVPLSDFLTTVNSKIAPAANQYGALKFIHRFDDTPDQNKWFLTVECGTIPKAGALVRGGLTYDHPFTPSPVPPPGTNRFDLFHDGSIVSNSAFVGNHDPVYFNNVKEVDGGVIDLNILQHVNYVTFPFECEILKLCEDNMIDILNPGNTQIVFAPIVTYCPPIDPALEPLSNVQFPHVVIVYLKGAANLLDDVIYGENDRFKMKAANFSTICPPRCDKYSWTFDLATC